MKLTILIALILVLPCFSSLGNAESASSNFQSLYSEGDKYSERGMYKKALNAYGRVLEFAQKVNDEDNYAVAASAIALIYFQMKKNQEAIKYYKIYEAYNLKKDDGSSSSKHQSIYFEKLKSLYSEKLQSLYSEGKKYSERGLYKEALNAYGRVLEFAQKVNDEDNYAVAANEIGWNYSLMKKYKKAIEYFKIYEAFNIKMGDETSLAFTLGHISTSYFLLHKYRKALEIDKRELAIYKKLNNKLGIAYKYKNIGVNLHFLDQGEEALENLEKALPIFRNLGKEKEIAVVLESMGSVYRSIFKYDQSIIVFKQALALHEKLKSEEKIASLLLQLGSIYSTKGKTKKALSYLEQAYDMFVSQKNQVRSITALGSIALAYNALGQYDKQIEIYKKTLNYHKKKGNENWVIHDYIFIGGVYSKWAKYDLAHKYFQQAVDLCKEYKDKTWKLMAILALGFNYVSMGQLDKALESFQESLIISQELGKKENIAHSLKGIANVQGAKKEYGKSVKTFKKALKIYTEMGDELAIGTILLQISKTYLFMKQYDKAWDYVSPLIEISQNVQNAHLFKNINELVATLYFIKKNYEQASQYFSKAIITVENTRKTATGNVRRDFLETQIFLYKYLALTFFWLGDFSSSFSALEQSKSRLLIDKLLTESKAIQIPKVAQIQNQMDADTAILAFGRIDPGGKTNEILLEYAITQDNFAGHVSNTLTLLSVYENLETVISNWNKNHSQIKLTNVPINTISTNYLENLVEYYRFILANPSSENDSALKEIGRALYDLLIKPLLSTIRGKKNLIIIPDGILSFVPFEALIDEKGNYLVEEFNIGYVQSMAVANLLRDRKYEGDQKPMLAFGGAIYNPVLSDQNIIETDIQLSALTVNTLESLSQNDTRSTSEALAKLGYGSWSNLPGTKREVEAINKIVANSEMLLGADVNEADIKEMSANGELSKYKILHFATHGLTVPDFPELSSIVLSQFDNEEKIEDGYLRMEEISKLKLKAEFVNLSACQTGLGRLYAGEGVVGLTYAFLLAGANGLSVSLWNVEDESTAKFMTGLYKLVEEKGITFSQGISEMKRSFIRGQVSMDTFDPDKSAQIIKDSKNSPNKLSHPFYWAPFVYYGKN